MQLSPQKAPPAGAGTASNALATGPKVRTLAELIDAYLAAYARQTHVDAALKSLRAMKKVLENRNLGEEVLSSLTSKAGTTEARVQHLLGDGATASDPLAALPSAKRTAYQHMISLIYECSANRIAAGALVERLLGRLSDETAQPVKPKAGHRRAKVAKRAKPRTKGR